jgi:hypothetical protein
MIEDFGMKYVLFTSKHHDGFSMWHSEYSDYDIAATPFKRDVLMELSESCQKKVLFLESIIQRSTGIIPTICLMEKAGRVSYFLNSVMHQTKTAIGVT